MKIKSPAVAVDYVSPHVVEVLELTTCINCHSPLESMDDTVLVGNRLCCSACYEEAEADLDPRYDPQDAYGIPIPGM